MSQTFLRGGIHPPAHKDRTELEPIRDIEPGATLFYPLSQHIGAPSVPVVAAGDTVRMGDRIADAAGFVSVPIHSSVSGTVVGIRPHMTLKGEPEVCIEISNDGLYTPAEGYGEPRDPGAMTPDEIRNAIRDAGIVGLGGAGFPMHVKLAVKEPETIDYLICNASECEPYLTSDARLMLERTADLVRGLGYLKTLFPKAQCLIGVEDNKPACISALNAEAGDVCRIVPLKARYPQGGERMLIQALTGRRLNSSLLPAQVGCVVVNVASVLAALDALEKHIPLIRKVMTVTGDAVNTPCNVRVSTGDLYSHVAEMAGGFSVTPEKLISGGPMMGIAMFTLDIPVVKTSASILALAKDPVAKKDMSPCIRCGACMRACPERLVPQYLALLSDRNDFELFERYGGMECIECGSCAYVCPAKRPLVQSMRYGRRETGALIRARKAAAQNAAGEGGKK